MWCIERINFLPPIFEVDDVVDWANERVWFDWADRRLRLGWASGGVGLGLGLGFRVRVRVELVEEQSWVGMIEEWG